MRKKFEIKSKIHDYSIYFEKNILNVIKFFPKNSVYIIDSNVYDFYLKNYLKNKKFIRINSNEKNKDFLNLSKIINFFVKNITKETKIIAVGGGVI